MKSSLSSLISLLPRHSSESGDCFSLSKATLAKRLSESANISLNDAAIMLEMAEAVLDSESTLDQEKLQQGEWQFVSFAAQLMGMSRLATLADPKARDVPKDFWLSAKLAYAKNNKGQTERLKKAEEIRAKSVNAEGGIPLPIRTEHIVWCFIKLDGKFLCHRKEEEKTSVLGEFSLIGGKMSESDFPATYEMAERLQLMNNDTLLDQKHEDTWMNAIKREIREEAAGWHMGDHGLEYEHDYLLSPLEPSLEPFSLDRGTGLIFSVARYWFKLYTMQLTLRGYLKLKNNRNTNMRLRLVSVKEMQNRIAGDAKLDIKALHEHYPGGFAALADKLNAMQNSFSIPYKLPCTGSIKNSAIIIPAVKGQSLQVATTAKKIVAGMDKLTQEECDLLLGLAAHVRGWHLDGVPEGVVLHCDGWIDTTNNEKIQKAMLLLVHKAPHCFDVDDSRYFRLSVNPDKLYFDERFFRFYVDVKSLNDFKSKSRNMEFTLYRLPMDTFLGTVSGDEVAVSTTKDRLRFFYECYRRGGVAASGKKDENGRCLALDDDTKAFDNTRRIMDGLSKKIGLRKAIAQVDTMFKVCIKMELMTADQETKLRKMLDNIKCGAGKLGKELMSDPHRSRFENLLENIVGSQGETADARPCRQLSGPSY